MRIRAVVWILPLAFVALVAVWAVGAIRGPRRLPAVPAELTARAVVPGIEGARYLVGVDLEAFVRDMGAARQREQATLAETGGGAELPPLEILAVSGGGDKGAFGAGLLCGWTEAGNRPRFKAVTGISTGALIAPFAFLGPDYDRVLREVYTSLTPEDVARKRSLLAAIDNDGMADNRPLWSLISKYVDAGLLAKIATEHEHGRVLLIGTTNLDARQPVVWNMGAIAASGAPNALDLFRSILLASAAIPGAFPPTMLRVEVDGKPYDEMHVDGGASAQVFLYPPSMLRVARELGGAVPQARPGRVWVIRNSTVAPTWSPVERRTISIASRAISSLIHTQGIGDLYRIYVTAQQDGLDFNLAMIGPEFHYPDKKQDFDTEYMRALFDYGFRLALDGDPWQKLPPGLETPWGGR